MSAILVPLLAQAITVSAGDRVESRVRNTDSGEQVDLVSTASGTCRLSSARASVTLTYAPAFTQLSLGGPDSARLLVHSASVAGDMQLSRRTTLRLTELASLGQQNFRVRSLGAPSPIDAEASPSATNSAAGARAITPPASAATGVLDSTIRYGALATSGSLTHQFSRRWSATSAGEYSVSTGLDSASRDRFPRMARLIGRQNVDFSASPRDSLQLVLEVSRADFAPVTSSVAIEMVELAWSRQLSREFDLRVGLGQAYWRWSSDAEGSRSGVVPIGGASIGYRKQLRDGLFQIDLSERVQPMVDRFLGTVSQRATTSLTASHSHHRTTISAAAYATYAFGDLATTARNAFGATQSVAYRFTDWVTGELGTRQAAFSGGAAGDTPLMWAAYVALAFSTGQHRL